MKRTAAKVVRAVAAVVALSSAGCGRAAPTGPGCAPAASGEPIDEHVVAFLSAARALHHEADVDERAGDEEKAVRALERLVRMPAPKATETEEVLADAYARLAELHLHQNELPAAGRDVMSGLEHATDQSYFRGHLLEVEGLVEERRALSLADAGSAQEAAEARARAVDLFEQAVGVQEHVIANALDSASPAASVGGLKTGDGGNDD